MKRVSPVKGIVPKLCPSRSNISKQSQTKPKIHRNFSIESTICNHTIYGNTKIWAENPRIGSSILSLGTCKIKQDQEFIKRLKGKFPSKMV
jgi:hypothetical protein